MSTPTAVENLFLAALARSDSNSRDAFLDDACRDDAELRRRVEVLLHAHERAGDFLDRPAAAELGPTVDTVSETPGARVGHYKLLQKLGEGGMGVVWVAEQLEPVKRRVALKLIKPGMDTNQVIARFEAERQALALMDHPNIAKVLDAGTTEGGRPYFVMELVKGVPITKYCDELQLSVRERLGLFLGVCQAIQHAHTKGVLHRDLKPSNVLVAIQDGRAVAKVIDFGVAKALNQRLTDRTLMTEFGAVVGTLEYMSPEQAELSALDVDTRADVYCLGVLLYELLTGSTPVTRQRLKQAAFDEALRIIREEEPPKPSTRLTESKESLASLAAMRRTEPRKLGAEVSGELDWIVMRCLEKDRARRYETASGLARDVDRHLNGEAVEACPPSVAYRLRKFVRKRRYWLAMAGVVLVMWTWAIIVTLVMAMHAQQAERVALDQRVQAEQALQQAVKEKERADDEAENAKAFLDFIRAHVLEQGRPGDAGDRNLRMKTVLDQALPHVEKRFRKQPLLEATARHTLGVAYARIGEVELARQQLERALALREANLEGRHPDVVATGIQLIALYQQLQDWDKVADLRERAVKRAEAVSGPDHVDVAYLKERLGSHYFDRSEYARAAPLFERAVAIRTKAGLRGADSPAGPMHELSKVYGALGKYAEAERLNEQVLETWRKELGEHHRNTFNARFTHALLLKSQGKHDQAKAAARKLQADFPYEARRVLGLLGACHLEAGEFDEAEKLFREVLRRIRKRSDVAPLDLAYYISLHAEALLGLKRDLEAEPLLRECMQIRDSKDKEGWQRFSTHSQLGGILLRRGEMATAEPLIRGGYEGLKEREARIHAGQRYHVRAALERLVALCEATGKTDEAARRREELASVKLGR